MFPDSHDGAMDSSDASMSTSLDLDEATTYTFYGQQIPQESRKARRMPVQHRTEYPDSPDISLNDVLHHDCAHGDGLRRRQECYGFDVSWEPHDGAMDSSDASNVYITGLKLQHILSGWTTNSAGISETRWTPVHTIQNIPIRPIFRSTTCPTSMTVHGDGLRRR
jgi:hypothetical protein